MNLRYAGKSAGEDSLILRMFFHASDGVNEESKDIAVLATNISSPGILDAPDSLAFGSVRIDSSKQVVLTLSNTGCEGIVIDSIVSTNTFAFKVGKISSTTIGSQAHISVPIMFTPIRIGKAVESLEIGTSAGHRFIKLTATGSQFVDGVEPSREESVELWPNPVADFLHVRSPDEGDLQIIIYDLLGRKVVSGRMQTHDAIDVHALPAGTYVARLTSESRSSLIRFSIVR